MHDTMPGDPPDRTPNLRGDVRAALDAAWVVSEGYTAPNTEVYPWLWLWDSCFHSLIWAELGEPDRAVGELAAALSTIDSAGFVAHMGYQLDRQRPVELWGRPGASSITQPPMFGHAIAQLVRRGIDVPPGLVEAATRALAHLLRDRRRLAGLIEIVHPWESGCDDSPRWDDLCPGDGFDLETWRTHKIDLLAHIERGEAGEPLHNPRFAVASVGFNALVAFNARELESATGDGSLADATDELVGSIDARFDRDRRTWIDVGPTEAGSGRSRTADGLLPLLVTADDAARHRVVEDVLDEDAYASAFGPRGVHIGEPTYEASTYWRGPVWPQLAYLLWVALDRAGEADAAEVVRTTTVAGAIESGLAEYWNGETGRGLGAIPESWSGLALVMAAAQPGAAGSV
jgi:hypothetical protein